MKAKYNCSSKVTGTYCYQNLNPIGARTCDCTTRALAAALSISWCEAVDLQASYAKKEFLALSDIDLLEVILIDNGFRRIPIPSCSAGGRRENAGQMANRLALGGAVLFMRLAHHVTCAKFGRILDTWDCSRRTVYRAYIKM